MNTPPETVVIPRALLAQLTALLAALLAAGEALVAPEPEAEAPEVVPEPEPIAPPEPRPDVVLSADEHDALLLRLEKQRAEVGELAEQLGTLTLECESRETRLADTLEQVEHFKQTSTDMRIKLREEEHLHAVTRQECESEERAKAQALECLDDANAKLENQIQGVLLESDPAPAPWALLLRFAPLFIVALVAIVHTIYSSAVAGANMIAAIKYLIVGAAVGLLIDFMQHPDAQPEQLDGIGRNAAWTRRMWMMALCGIALAVRP